MIPINVHYRDSRGDHAWHYDVPVVPRIGELVKIDGNWYRVESVKHDLGQDSISLHTSFVGYL